MVSIRYQILCSAYLTEKSVIYPLHNCCDVCEIVCACDTYIRPNNHKKVQVGKDQEKTQSEKDSHSKNRGGKKPK